MVIFSISYLLEERFLVKSNQSLIEYSKKYIRSAIELLLPKVLQNALLRKLPNPKNQIISNTIDFMIILG